MHGVIYCTGIGQNLGTGPWSNNTQFWEIVEAAKSEARLEADKIKSAAQIEMDQERNRAREELRQEVADLVIMGAEKILAREVDEKSHREILKQISSDM